MVSPVAVAPGIGNFLVGAEPHVWQVRLIVRGVCVHPWEEVEGMETALAQPQRRPAQEAWLKAGNSLSIASEGLLLSGALPVFLHTLSLHCSQFSFCSALWWKGSPASDLDCPGFKSRWLTGQVVPLPEPL